MRLTFQSNTARRIAAISVASMLLLTSIPTRRMNTVKAFKPFSNIDFLKGTPSDITHQDMTEIAIKLLIKNESIITGVTKVTNSMERAINDIKKHNGFVDIYQYLGSAEHFTDESFSAGQALLWDHLNAIVTSLARDDVKSARTHTGQALHAIQDFYAHSNWVEKGMSSPNQELGRYGQMIQNTAGRGEATCTDCVECSGGNPTTCFGNITTSKLTTSYFRTIPYYGDKPPGKCSHGGPGDLSDNEPATGGINKDSLSCDHSPHYYLHSSAANMGLEATKQFMRDIKEKVTLKQFKALLGVGPPLAFAIDTTGSMADEIAGVKQQAIQIVDSRVNSALEPPYYVLVGFNDPLTGPIIVTEDADAYKLAISSLTSNGGDDCPEYANNGMLLALQVMDAGGNLFVFTDATAKDNNLAYIVRGYARSKDIQITDLLSGSCSPIDPEYYRTARETGGQVFVYDPLQSADATKLMDFLVRPDRVDVLSISSTLSGSPVTYSAPVDSTMTRVTFSVSGTSNVTVKRPDGSTVLPTDAGVTVVSLSSGAISTIVNPTQGTWNVTVNGSGNVSVRVTGESTLNFSSFDFVELGGWPDHEGYFPVTGHPLAGQLSKATAEISAENVSTAQFELRNGAGTVLQTLTLTESTKPSDRLTREFYGDVTVPNTSYLAYVTGTDTNGQAYQRVVPGLTVPQTIHVGTPLPQDLYSGRTTTFKFPIKNIGAAGTFQVFASDDINALNGFTPTTLTLATNETKEVIVEMQPAVDTPPGVVATLTVSVNKVGNSNVNNYAVVTSAVKSLPDLRLGNVTTAIIVGDDDACVEPNEIAGLRIQLRNVGGSAATNVAATLTTSTPGVTITSGTSVYADLPVENTSLPSGNGINRTPFTFTTQGSCGQTISFNLSVTQAGSVGSQEFSFNVSTNLPGPPVVISYTGPAVAIPDGNIDSDGPPINIPITVSGLTGPIADLNFRINGTLCTAAAAATSVGIDHSYVADLVVKLTSPQGTTVTLIDGAGGGLNDGNNFCQTVLDDERGVTLIDLILPAGPPPLGPPYTGTFIPERPLTSFLGEDPNGTWTLTVMDRFADGTGNVRAFSLVISTYQ